MTTDSVDGLSFRFEAESLTQLIELLDQFIQAGLLRCLSPVREELCDNPATMIFWQDEAEWYPCCEEHEVANVPWTGDKPFTPKRFNLPVISNPARLWLAGDPTRFDFITLQTYQRI